MRVFSAVLWNAFATPELIAQSACSAFNVGGARKAAPVPLAHETAVDLNIWFGLNTRTRKKHVISSHKQPDSPSEFTAKPIAQSVRCKMNFTTQT